MLTDQPWTRHRKGLSHDGRCVCLRCGAEMPYTIPIERIVCSKEDRLYLGDMESAVDCRVATS
jgi:hypothetical protein